MRFTGRHQHARAPTGKSGTDLASGTVEHKSIGRIILRGPLYFALGLCIGVSVYFALDFEPGLVETLGLAGVVLALGFAGLRLSLPRSVRLLAMIAMGIACGGAAAKLHTDLRPAPRITQTIGPVMLEGWVTSVEAGEKGARLRLTVHAIAGETSASMPRHVRLTHVLSLNVAPGRFVRCRAVLRPPPQPSLPGDYEFNRQAFFGGLDAVGYVQGRCRGGPLGKQRGWFAGLQLWVSSVRRQLAVYVNEAAGERAGGFAAALTSGDRSFMPQADMEALRNSGLAHLLAISGLHLGIVATLVFFAVKRTLSAWEWFALRVPTQKPAALAVIVATCAYMILSGASISTQRAFIMAAVVFVAMLLERSALSLRTFAIAMIVVILLEPASVMSPGFQMSFAATGGLIAAYEAWNRREAERGYPGRRGIGFVLKSLVVTSLVGAMATAPFAVYHFDRLAPYGLAANLLAMPIITFISAPAAGLALVAAPFGLSDIFLRVFGWSLERVLDIAYWTAGPAERGFSMGEAMPPVVLAVLIGGLAGACLGAGWRSRLAMSGAALAAAAGLWMQSPKLIVHWSASGDVFAASEAGMARWSFQDGEGLNPLQFSDLAPEGDCLEGCSLETSAGLLLIGPAGWIAEQCSAAVKLVLSVGASSNPPCPSAAITEMWEDVQTSGGVTLQRSADGRLIRHVPMCGHRPWIPCLDDRVRPDQS